MSARAGETAGGNKRTASPASTDGEGATRKRMCVATLDLRALELRLIRRGIVPVDSVPEALRCYREFLELKAEHRDVDAVLFSPSLLVDSVWHAHIIDTKGYAQCCATLLGENELLHHDPDGDVDSTGRARRVANTQALYKVRFGRECAWTFDRAPSARPDANTDGWCTLKISGPRDEDTPIHFKCRVTTPFQRMFEPFLQRRGLSMESVRFLHQGSLIHPEDTPAQSLEMVDGGETEIDAMLPQYGC